MELGSSRSMRATTQPGTKHRAGPLHKVDPPGLRHRQRHHHLHHLLTPQPDRGGRQEGDLKERDPTVLAAPSAGKLLQYLVEDRDHVSAGDCYGEIEVMKMVMALTVPESGRIHFVKRPGAVLVPGCVVARIDLDDPSSIHLASPPAAAAH
ncbi:hypothetical protein CRUP_007736 [Coryphaenoides rupestris]|nr:hypothetical protein CRUP_007736 [Coryphaenoides rupestris]